MTFENQVPIDVQPGSVYRFCPVPGANITASEPRRLYHSKECLFSESTSVGLLPGECFLALETVEKVYGYFGAKTLHVLAPRAVGFLLVPRSEYSGEFHRQQE